WLMQCNLHRQVHNYLHVFAVSCLFYDHAITFGQEIDYLWKRPKTRSSYWFFVNRYLAFFGNIAVTVLGFTTLSTQSCKKYNIFRQVLLVGNQVIVCILLTLRIYALYGCSLRILAYFIGSGVILLIVSLWFLLGQKSAPSESASGCHIGLSSGTAKRLAVAWEALFIYDAIIFLLTILKTWKARRDHNVTGIHIPLITLILRDGAIYFGVMASCNLANILTFYLAGPFLQGGLSTFASSISVTMMCRLTLNLHRTADKGLLSTGASSRGDRQISDDWTDSLDIISPQSMDYEMEQNPQPRSRSRRQ
ncbi:hypothetical protein BJ912DRAFT_951533, partial [Pholiota molesta]